VEQKNITLIFATADESMQSTEFYPYRTIVLDCMGMRNYSMADIAGTNPGKAINPDELNKALLELENGDCR
jgi:hypothetical protein